MVTSNNLKLTLCASIAIAGMLLPSSLFAGTDGKESKQVVEPLKPAAITGDLGVNFVSEYISRGFIVENKGVIAQPYVDLYLPLYQGTGAIDKVVLNLGLWSSINSHATGAAKGNTVRDWNELDWTPGVSVTFLKNFTITPSYFEFDSPNGAYNPSRNFNLRLDYSDADLLGAFALHPHVTYLKELSGKNTNAPANKKGDYYEVGIVPGLPAFGPVTVTLPVVAGFGSAGFYAGDKHFGYASAGPNVAIAIPCVPARLGVWSVNFGATYYYMHSAAALTPADYTTGNNSQWVFNGGVGMTF